MLAIHLTMYPNYRDRSKVACHFDKIKITTGKSSTPMIKQTKLVNSYLLNCMVLIFFLNKHDF